MTRIVDLRMMRVIGRREMPIPLRREMRIARSRGAPGIELETRVAGRRGMAMRTRTGRVAE
jgi:hypothetical protein